MVDNKIKKKKTGDDTPGWMLTFADLVSLLICFFVLLYSMKSVNEDIWKQITGSFAGALNYNQKFKKIEPNNNSGADVDKILGVDSVDYLLSVITSKLSKDGVINYVDIKKDNIDTSIHVSVLSSNIFDKNTSVISVRGARILSIIASCVMYFNGELEIANDVKPDPHKDMEDRSIRNSLIKSAIIRERLKNLGVTTPIKIIGNGSELYESLEDLYSEDELEEHVVKMDLIIKSNAF